MYSCIVFFPDAEVKKWNYVRDLKGFSEFLSNKHPTWEYFNVYEKGSKQFLKRFYFGNVVPKLLMVLILLTQKFTLSDSFNTFNPSNQYPLKNTFDKSFDRTFNIGFNNSATNPTQS